RSADGGAGALQGAPPGLEPSIREARRAPVSSQASHVPRARPTKRRACRRDGAAVAEERTGRKRVIFPERGKSILGNDKRLSRGKRPEERETRRRGASSGIAVGSQRCSLLADRP